MAVKVLSFAVEPVGLGEAAAAFLAERDLAKSGPWVCALTLTRLEQPLGPRPESAKFCITERWLGGNSRVDVAPQAHHLPGVEPHSLNGSPSREMKAAA